MCPDREVAEGHARYGNLETHAHSFARLRVNRKGDHVSPHKPCMLLAVLDLAAGGDLVTNEIRYEPALLERYERYFAAVKRDRDHAKTYYPFFHLKSAPFWTLVPREGRAETLDAMSTARRHRDITDNIDHVKLDAELFRLIQDESSRAALRDVLLTRWFPGNDARIRACLAQQERENTVERQLRSGTQPQESSTAIRDTVFRRIVLEAYDYRCAATGLRLLVPGVGALLDAAHLIPFAAERNDAPTNGMALTPTYHRALDRRLIAPGPDLLWHVSPILDRRISDYRPLLDLEGQRIILPVESRMQPSKESLAWTLRNLAPG